MDSSSLEYERRKDVFVKNYFDTNEGDDALRVLVIPPIVLNFIYYSLLKNEKY
jgi:hypothetical protein